MRWVVLALLVVIASSARTYLAQTSWVQSTSGVVARVDNAQAFYSALYKSNASVIVITDHFSGDTPTSLYPGDPARRHHVRAIVVSCHPTIIQLLGKISNTVSWLCQRLTQN